MSRRGLALVALLAALAVPAVASAATRQQATNRIAACMKHAGAIKITRHRGGVLGVLRAPFNITSPLVVWGDYLVAGGQVVATPAVPNDLNARQRRAANRCLRPFNGHV